MHLAYVWTRWVTLRIESADENHRGLIGWQFKERARGSGTDTFVDTAHQVYAYDCISGEPLDNIAAIQQESYPP